MSGYVGSRRDRIELLILVCLMRAEARDLLAGLPLKKAA